MPRSTSATVCTIVVITLLAAGATAQPIDDIPINKPECMTWDSLYNRYLVSLNIDNDIVQVDQNGVVTPFREDLRTRFLFLAQGCRFLTGGVTR